MAIRRRLNVSLDRRLAQRFAPDLPCLVGEM